MASMTAAVDDLNTVACETRVRTCSCGLEPLTIVNTGETTVVVEQPLLKIKRVA